MWAKFLCVIGYHGPEVLGYLSKSRSERVEPFVRICRVCGAEWHGDEVTKGRGINAYRSVAWEQVK